MTGYPVILSHGDCIFSHLRFSRDRFACRGEGAAALRSWELQRWMYLAAPGITRAFSMVKGASICASQSDVPRWKTGDLKSYRGGGIVLIPLGTAFSATSSTGLKSSMTTPVSEMTKKTSASHWCMPPIVTPAADPAPAGYVPPDSGAARSPGSRQPGIVCGHRVRRTLRRTLIYNGRAPSGSAPHGQDRIPVDPRPQRARAANDVVHSAAQRP